MRWRSLLAGWLMISRATSPCADVHYASPDGSDQYPFISPATAARAVQDAVDAADPGDVVMVYPGEYRGDIQMKPGIVLLPAGAASPRVWGSIFAAEDCVIQGLSVMCGGIALGGKGGQYVANCTISTSGTALGCGGELRYRPSKPVVITRTVVNGASVGIRLRDSPPPVFVDSCSISGCDTGVVCWMGSGTLVLARSSINANYHGMYVNDRWHVEVILSFLERNRGTGVTVEDQARVAVSNSTICSNGGPAISTDWAYVDILNCTISDNEHGIFCGETQMTLHNTIAHGNRGWTIYNFYAEAAASFCDIEGGYPGEGNIDADPIFGDPESGDFRLRAGSPCIDAGFNSPDVPEKDIAGMHRVLFGGKSLTVDMGAYEFYINKLDPVPGTNEALFTWSSLANKTYSIFYTDDLFNWHTAIANFPSSGNQTTSWTDDGSLTGLAPLLAPRRFYRVLENP